MLKKDGVTVGKAILSLGLKNAEVIPDVDGPSVPRPSKVQLDNASLAPDSMIGGGSHVMSGVFNQDSVPQLYVRDPREETMQLLNSSNQLPRMPWNTVGADESLNGLSQSRIFNGAGSVRTHGNKSYGDMAGSVVFDPRLLSAVPAKKSKQFYDFHISIYEVDLWDMVAVVAKQNNSYMVSAACGKWATSTPVSRHIICGFSSGSLTFLFASSCLVLVGAERNRKRLLLD
ncbi:hypothetical protein EON65_08955 [archaeon]|nr:MAG: hypothetical protein EON65_08955 [archaeon]